MQLHHLLPALLLAVSCAGYTLGDSHDLVRRQDATTTTEGESVPSSSIAPDSEPTSDVQTSSAPSEEENQTSDALSSSTTTTPTAEVTSQSAAETTSSPTSTVAPKSESKLPVQPTITPALGVAGVILLVTGVAFCLVGIKHKWLQIYLSSAYATSLATSVLIFYVMEPPVSDALQGAYLVAIVVTGLIFGGLSLIFKEVTQGLGCLIGGFCLAMWFLVLKEDGLVTSQSGRAITIGVFSAVGLSLSFSQYTRTYGIIGCTAFAGAQIAILGVDFFSRAGLKEFWLYLWGLNKDFFPLGTTTYPITRGIRVEIAATVILFLFGVMSQLKMWKIVRARRQKREAQRQADDERRDQLAGEVGHDVEALNERSRAQWEATYGDKDTRKLADSGRGSLAGRNLKKSASVTEREINAIEMNDSPGSSMPRTPNHQGSATSSNAMTKGTLPRLSSEWRIGDDMDLITPTDSAQSVTNASRTTLDQTGRAARPESAGDGHSETSGNTASTSDQPVATVLNPSAVKKLNKKTPKLMPTIEDERASSVAATADEDADMDNFSVGRLSQPLSPNRLSFHDDARKSSVTPRPGSRVFVESAAEDDDEKVLGRPSQTSDYFGNNWLHANSHVRHSRSTQHSRSLRNSGIEGQSSEDPRGEKPEEEAMRPLTAKDLPRSISKVAKAHRTNEWAKHILDAEQPERRPDEPEEPNEQANDAFKNETARPVDTAALQEIPIMASTGGPRKPSQKEPKTQDKKGKNSLKKRPSLGVPVYSFQANNSSSSVRPPQQSYVAPSRRESRKSSGPLSAEGFPFERALASPGLYSRSSARNSSANLLDQRNDRLDRRSTTTNFNGLTTLPTASDTAPDDPANPSADEHHPTPLSDLPNEEDMTLTQRKYLLHSKSTSQRQSSLRPKSSTRPNTSADRTTGNLRNSSTPDPRLVHDSHQPQRSASFSATRQSAMLSQWRRSLAQDATPQVPAVDPEHARRQMISQHEQAAHERARRQDERMRRESMMDVAMRSGQLHHAHTGVLRKMQAQANSATK